MNKTILIDEFHCTFFVPRGLPESESDAITQTLNGKDFEAKLRQAVRQVVGQYPTLAKVGVLLSR